MLEKVINFTELNNQDFQYLENHLKYTKSFAMLEIYYNVKFSYHFFLYMRNLRR